MWECRAEDCGAALKFGASDAGARLRNFLLWTGEARRLPVRRDSGDAPEFGVRADELDGYLSLTHECGAHMSHTAEQFLPSRVVFEHDKTVHADAHGENQERAVGVDDNRVGGFGLRLLILQAHHDGYPGFDPFAAPTELRTEVFIEITRHICTLATPPRIHNWEAEGVCQQR